MSLWVWPCLNEERGAATVELAIVATILVPLILYANFFSNLASTGLSLQEASRFSLWESAVGVRTEYSTGDARKGFAQLQSTLPGEVRELLADRTRDDRMAVSWDLDGMTLGLKNQRAKILPVDGSGLVGGVAGEVFEHFGFNVNGRIASEVSLPGEALLPTLRFPFGFNGPMVDQPALGLTSRQSLLVDAWNLTDLKGIEAAQSTRCASAFCKQVDRMTWLGFKKKLDKLGGNAILKQMESLFDIHLPATAVAVSLPLDGKSDSHVDLDVAKPDGFRPLRRHYTNVFKYTITPSHSAINRAYNARGPHYLGCPRSQRRETHCTDP